MTANTRVYTVVIHPADPDETGFWAEVPALPGCFSQGETLEETISHAQEAIRCHLEALMESGEPLPAEAPPRTEIRVMVSTALPEVA